MLRSREGWKLRETVRWMTGLDPLTPPIRRLSAALRLLSRPLHKAAVASAPTVEALTVWPFCFFPGDAVSSIGDQRSAVQAFVSRIF